MGKIYLKLAIYFWRKVAMPIDGKNKIGLPRYRDPDNVCDYYEPRKPRLGDFQDCNGDGHYLCKVCCHLKKGGSNG